MEKIFDNTTDVTEAVLNTIAHLPTTSLPATIDPSFWKKLKDEDFMRIAVLLARKGYDEGGCPIGAVIIDNETHMIVGKGHNTLVQENHPYNHGETSAIRDAGRLDFSKTTIFTSLSPCDICSTLLYSRLFNRVVVGNVTTISGNEPMLREKGIIVDILEDDMGIALYEQYRKEKPDLDIEDWRGKERSSTMPNNVFVLDHPLAGTFLDRLRDKNSNSETFRAQTRRLGRMLALEISKDLATTEKSCVTPMQETSEKVITDSVGLVPILRAGIGLVDPFLDFLPEARVLYIGMYRDEDTHQPVSYYNKLEDTEHVDTAYIIDPMLATGGSAIAAVNALSDWGINKIKFAGLIGAPEGVKALHNAFPDVDIHLAALDEKLNDNAYILPGLGDAGDRIFNT